MLTYRSGSAARRRGLDLTISLTADQAAALGVDAGELAEALDTVLVGLAALRAGRDPQVPADAGMSLKDQPVTAGVFFDEWLIRDASSLRERMKGLLSAAIRAHVEHGGTYGTLATAMDVPRATAQRRRDAVTEKAPGDGESWASTPAAPIDRNDDEHQGATVNVATTGHRPIQAGHITGDINVNLGGNVTFGGDR